MICISGERYGNQSDIKQQQDRAAIIEKAKDSVALILCY